MHPDTEARIAATLLPDYKPPAADLGYCACGTVWNIEAIEALGFARGRCPDCGSTSEWIEPARPA